MTATQITSLIWLGNMIDATHDKDRFGYVLNVIGLMEPINDKWQVDVNNAKVDINMLNAIAAILDHLSRCHTPTLIHCQEGIERSPLALAWFLVRSNRFKNLNQAYDYIRVKRPIIQDRQSWL